MRIFAIAGIIAASMFLAVPTAMAIGPPDSFMTLSEGDAFATVITDHDSSYLSVAMLPVCAGDPSEDGGGSESNGDGPVDTSPTSGNTPTQEGGGPVGTGFLLVC